MGRGGGGGKRCGAAYEEFVVATDLHGEFEYVPTTVYKPLVCKYRLNRFLKNIFRFCSLQSFLPNSCKTAGSYRIFGGFFLYSFINARVLYFSFFLILRQFSSEKVFFFCFVLSTTRLACYHNRYFNIINHVSRNLLFYARKLRIH